MAEFVVEFGSVDKLPEPDGRLHGPALQRNHGAIWSALSPFLLGRIGDVLEVGSGTGQHIAEFARLAPDLTWWPSDIYPSHLASIEVWRRHAGLANLRAPQWIDLADPAWSWTADGQAGGTLAAMYQRAAHRTVARNAKPVCRRRLLFARRWPAVRLWPVHARWRAHCAEQRRLQCKLTGRKSRMGCARPGRSERARARSRPDGGRNRAHAGQQSGPGVCAQFARIDQMITAH